MYFIQLHQIIAANEPSKIGISKTANYDEISPQLGVSAHFIT